ncbi:MAG: hypothetical protein ABSF80_01680 [Chitinispirillaceae bacterium]
MKRFSASLFFAVISCVQIISGQTFTVTINSGNPLIYQTKTGSRAPITSSTVVGMGDSLVLSTGSQVTIGLETNSRLMYKGPGILAITGDSSAAYLSFDQGQVFLDRNDPTSFSVLTFWVKNYMFVPVGTAASIKVMNSGMPAVAVIEGKVLMQSPSGESVEIAAGNFGCVEGSGRITSGTLGSKVITALGKWSGVKAGARSAEAKSSSSLETIDQEFIAAAEIPAAAASGTATGGATPQEKNPQSSEPTAAATAPASTGSPAPTGEGQTNAAPETSGAPENTSFELSAGAVTVNNQQWTRLAFGIDVPVWKFGVFFDIEAFLDQQGNFSNKGWDFKNDAFDAVTRKIRYIRFGHEQDPVFLKVGGLTDVTMGYGFIVDRFTNMLHYPDQKFLGVQLYLNDLTPAGITLQLMGADLGELRDPYQGGFGAARLAIRPLKTSGYPVISNLAIGATYAYDRNTYAPARSWKSTTEEKIVSILSQGTLTNTQKQELRDSVGIDFDQTVTQMAAEENAKIHKEPFGIYGVDLGLPLIANPFFSLDLYAESGMRDDAVRGWGIGAPGVALKIWRFSASLEYRHTEGRFIPGFFDPYYLDERLVRSPSIVTKAGSLNNDTLNGVFGRLGFDIAKVLVIDGSYQYLTGSVAADKDQRFEITGSVGSLILDKIPKIKKLEIYLYKTNIGADIVKYDSTGTPLMTNGGYTYDRFFQTTPFMYYGYRLGFEITHGATLICDTRFGYMRDSKGTLSAYNNVFVQTAFSF